MYKRQLLESQYLQFVDELDKAIVYGRLLKKGELGEEFKPDIELSLNKAWAKAFVVLPDEIFLEIDKLLTRGSVVVASRNRIYYILRKSLYPKTDIKYDDYIDRLISILETDAKPP